MPEKPRLSGSAQAAFDRAPAALKIVTYSINL
jgi:hypothetical protein